MKIATGIRGLGGPRVELTRAEMRILRAASSIEATCRGVLGDGPGAAFIKDSIAAINRIEADELAVEAAKAGAEEEERPIIKAAKKGRKEAESIAQAAGATT